MASSSQDGTVRVYQISDWKLRAELKGHSGSVSQVVFFSTKDSERLATASADKTIRLWQLQTPSTSKELSGHTDKCTCVAWAQTVWDLISGSADGTIRVWD